MVTQEELFTGHFGNESSWFSDNQPSILEWGSEEVIIPYRAPDGVVRRYYPDFYIKVL